MRHKNSVSRKEGKRSAQGRVATPLHKYAYPWHLFRRFRNLHDRAHLMHTRTCTRTHVYTA